MDDIYRYERYIKVDQWTRKKRLFRYSVGQLIGGACLVFSKYELTRLFSVFNLTLLVHLTYFVLFIMGIIVLIQIIDTDKKFKRFSGPYSIKPPEGFYD